MIEMFAIKEEKRARLSKTDGQKSHVSDKILPPSVQNELRASLHLVGRIKVSYLCRIHLHFLQIINYFMAIY